jgi:hypothetical protein
MSNQVSAQDYIRFRKIKLGQMVTELRGSEKLLNEFLADPGAVAKRYGLQFTEREKENIVEIATVKIPDQLDATALGAVGGGAYGEDTAGTFDNNCNCNSGGTTSGW